MGPASVARRAWESSWAAGVSWRRAEGTAGQQSRGVQLGRSGGTDKGMGNLGLTHGAGDSGGARSGAHSAARLMLRRAVGTGAGSVRAGWLHREQRWRAVHPHDPMGRVFRASGALRSPSSPPAGPGVGGPGGRGAGANRGGLVLPEARQSNDALRTVAPDSESRAASLLDSVGANITLLAFNGRFR